jgi:co-chaperonin GroES (HSP10)
VVQYGGTSLKVGDEENYALYRESEILAKLNE